ncbi:MAG: uroporphyrinogen-III C-methyltransferase [Methylophilaceae bacterium]|nr:uroporphyrinogen-III C-methyltransferase [Methylophilaceae bacterium]
MSETDPMLSPQTEAARPERHFFAPAMVVAILAIVLLAWHWLDSRQRYTALELTLSQRLNEFDTRNRESQLLAQKAEESGTQLAARIALIEQKLAESRNQQEALQVLYQEFANNRDERVVAEVEQLLVIASEQLQLAGNIRSALLALQTADMRLQQIDKPQAIQLRKLIGRDIARLQALPAVDVVGASLRMEALASTVDKLPLMSEHHPRPATDAIAPDYETNPWRRLAGEIWRDIRQLVRIERIDRPEPPLLTPEQSFFLRENLRLRLLTARIALLQRDEATFHADLRAAEEWLKRYFDTDDPAVKNAVATVHQLGSSTVNIQLPDLAETLNAANRYKLTLERSAQ